MDEIYEGRHRTARFVDARNFGTTYDNVGVTISDEGRRLSFGVLSDDMTGGFTFKGEAVEQIRKALVSTVDIDQLADLCDDYSKAVSHLITRQAVNRRTKTGDTTAEENAVYVAEADIRNYLAGGKP